MSSLNPKPADTTRDGTVSSCPAPLRAEEGVPRWSVTTRVAFRFFFLYLGLFILFDAVLMFPVWMLFNPIPNSRFTLGELPPFRDVVFWVSTRVFHLPQPSGPYGLYEPRPAFWVFLLCILILGIIGTIVWSLLDPKGQSYPKLLAWFRAVVLLLLSAAMFFYGTGKVIPVQMWFPRLSRLLERFGDFSPMAVLWTSIGASRGYEVFTGCAEIAGGLLLVIPRTTLLGALICAADLTNVFTLNMT